MGRMDLTEKVIFEQRPEKGDGAIQTLGRAGKVLICGERQEANWLEWGRGKRESSGRK